MIQAGSLSGVRKAAILLLTLGPDVAASIMKHLSDREIEEVTLEISRIREMPSEAIGPILEEFVQLAQAHGYILHGGFKSAREFLHKAIGSERGDEILDRLAGAFTGHIFASLHKADPRQLTDFLRREHPQTVALILANVDPQAAAVIVTNLEPEVRIDVVHRLASMETTNPEVLKQVDQVLEKRLASMYHQEVSTVGGTRAVAELLNVLEREVTKGIFEGLEASNASLAEEIRRHMFTFEDLSRLDDRSIQRLLKEVEQRDLALALKGASDDLKTRIFRNLSERAQNLLRQEIEYLGPVRIKDVEGAQGAVVRAVRDLEEAGEIFISQGNDVLV